MGIKDYPFQLYVEQQPNLVKLDLTLSYDFFEDLRILAVSWWYKANPHNQPLKHCMRYDVINFLGELLELNSDKVHKLLSDSISMFPEINTPVPFPSVYMHPADIEVVRKELHKHKAPFIEQYFLHEFCFLVSYYSWLIPKEMKVDYKKHMLGIFPIQPEEEKLENYLEKRELTYKSIRKIIEDETTPQVLRDRLKNWDYWKEIRKRMGLYYEIKEELKTTNKESPNIMLLKHRAYLSFYCFLKYTVCPTSNTYHKNGGFVSKYAVKNFPLIPSISKERKPIPDWAVAIDDIFKKKLYINSERKLQEIVGGFFELIKLSAHSKGFAYIKHYQEQQTSKRIKRGPVYGIKQDGTKVILYTKEQVDQQIADAAKEFNIKTKVDSLKGYAKKLNSKVS